MLSTFLLFYLLFFDIFYFTVVNRLITKPVYSIIMYKNVITTIIIREDYMKGVDNYLILNIFILYC